MKNVKRLLAALLATLTLVGLTGLRRQQAAGRHHRVR